MVTVQSRGLTRPQLAPTILLHSTWPYEVPMKGLGIGQQLGWLAARLTAPEPRD